MCNLGIALYIRLKKILVRYFLLEYCIFLKNVFVSSFFLYDYYYHSFMVKIYLFLKKKKRNIFRAIVSVM